MFFFPDLGAMYIVSSSGRAHIPDSHVASSARDIRHCVSTEIQVTTGRIHLSAFYTDDQVCCLLSPLPYHHYPLSSHQER